MIKDSSELRLQDNLIESFMSEFFGYGNLDSKFWYIGMEEGGGTSFDEVDRRLQVWKSLKCRPTVDLKDYHLKIGIAKFFEENPPIQRTWSKLIRVHLSLNDLASGTEDIRRYQCEDWGRIDGNSCLLELMPLPSPGIGTWKYNQYSDLPFLASRDEYFDYLLAKRIRCLRQMIGVHKPRLVLFYGLSPKYLKAWTKIIGEAPSEAPIKKLRIHSTKQTEFAVCPHPVARGYTNVYFESVGNYLREKLKAKVSVL